jgi:outer membrane immunogenic protein
MVEVVFSVIFGVERMRDVIRQTMFATAGLCLASSAVIAADLAQSAPSSAPGRAPAAYVSPVSSPYNWTGVYIGANAGYGFATASATATLAGVTATSSENLSGFVGGGQLGGNYQIGSVVLGLEADFDYSGQCNTTTAGIFSERDSIPWIGTLRGRIGYVIDRVMIYGAAGGVEGKFSSTITAASFGSISGSKTQGAWTAGAGVEVGLTENLSCRIEYLYIDSGNIKLATIGPLTVTGRVQDNLVRAGLNWRFR